MAAACYRAGLGPNTVSMVSAALTMTGVLGIALVPPSWAAAAAVWFCLAVGYAFDSADGQVARLQGGGSLAGEWLDHFLDSIKLACLHLAVAVSAFRFFDLENVAWLLVPLGFTAVSTVTFFAMILNDQLKAGHVLRTGAAPAKRSGNWRRSVILLPTDYGVLCLVFLFLGMPQVFVVLYTALFAASLGYLAAAAPKWFIDMRKLQVRA